MKKYLVAVTMTVLAAMLVTGCGAVQPEALVPPSKSTPSAGVGMLEVRVTDKPTPNVEEIWVTVDTSEGEGVTVHKAATEGDGAAGWMPIPITDPTFELLELKEEGVDQLLGWSEVAAGKYTQIRMSIAEVNIKFEDSDDMVPAKLPSGKLKFVHPFEVVDGGTTILEFDFIADKSLVTTGKGNVIFKPVIKLSVSMRAPGEAPSELEIITPSLPNGGVGVEYEAEVEAMGGTEPYTWSISAGALPDGLELDPDDGVISGTPEAESEGDYTFTVQVEDDAGTPETDTREFSISIAAEGVLIITTTSLPDGGVGVEYEAEVEAIGGTEPYTWSISAGALPDGLELDPGTPEAESEGDYTFTVQVEDDAGTPQTDTQEFSISIAAVAELEIITTSLPDGEVGVEYEEEVEATGGTEPYTWSISAGALPDGLELDPDDAGTPEAESEGDYTFTVQVEDDAGTPQTDTQEFSISIAAA
jgi:hypothetical protein